MSEPPEPERTYMVYGIDDMGDLHLFASDDLSRAENAFRRFSDMFEQSEASWLACEEADRRTAH